MVITRLWLLWCDETCWISTWLSTIPGWKDSALQRLSSSLTERNRKRLKQRVCKTQALGCLHIHLAPAFSSSTHITYLHSFLTGVCWGRPLKGRWSCSIYSQHCTSKQGPVLKGPQHKAQRLGALLPWRLLAAGRQLPHPCRTHKCCSYTCTPPAKMYTTPIY